MYSVIESAGHIQPVLSISNQTLTNITVEVFTTNVSQTAIGKYIAIIIIMTMTWN